LIARIIQKFDSPANCKFMMAFSLQANDNWQSDSKSRRADPRRVPVTATVERFDTPSCRRDEFETHPASCERKSAVGQIRARCVQSDDRHTLFAMPDAR